MRRKADALRLGLSCLVALSGPCSFSGAQNTVSAVQNQPDFRITSENGFARVPFELYWDGILLHATVNNSQPILLALDTGAGINIFNERLFKMLGLKDEGPATVTGGGGTASGRFVQNATIGLPGAEAYKQLIASAPLDAMSLMGRDVEGLLGTPFLKNFVVEIDYEKKIVTFYDPKVRSLSAEPDAIAMEGREGMPFVRAELTLNDRESVAGEFMVDSGSNRIFHVAKRFAEAHKFFSILPSSAMTEGLGEAIGGRTTFIEARIPSIRIGKYSLQRPVVSITQNAEGIESGTGATGIIGAEMLRRFTVVLDYASSRLLLTPNAHFNEPFEIDMSGLEIVSKPDDAHAFVIKSVLPHYPAAEAGLREGDEFMSIDGRPASEFDLDQLVRMFKEPEKSYSLTIQRRRQKISVVLTMKRKV